MFVLHILIGMISVLLVMQAASSKLPSTDTVSLVAHYRSNSIEMQNYIRELFINPATRSQILAHANNPSLACIRLGGDCYDAGQVTDGAHDFRVINWVPRLDPPQGGLPGFFDATRASNGLDSEWRACRTYDPVNPPAGATCIYRPNISWRPACAVGPGCTSGDFEVRVWVNISAERELGVNAMKRLTLFTIQ